ncbi:MAG TPA: hypothetical protein VMK65_13325 [Longimicrobiales bacterium]|nr:hypothetical protein [Longimicrobiales bacterium]
MRRPVSLLALALLSLACARPVAVESEPGTAYAIQVANATGAPLQVSFEAGAEPRYLGPVAAGASERFIVVSPGGPSVTLVAEGPGFTLREPVTLRAGETVGVTLRR